MWGDNYKNNSEILSRLQVILSAGSDSASPSNPNCDKNWQVEVVTFLFDTKPIKI